MKHDIHSFRRASARAAAIGAIFAATALTTAPLLAAQAAAPATGADRVETRISEMHATLKITANQEDKWSQVAQVMRDTEKTIEPLVKNRQANSKTMNAIDDLKSYSEISRAHAQGAENLTTAFEPLYAAMTDDQKKEADTLFRNGMRKKGKVSP